MSKKFHSFHIVEQSPWPLLTAFSAFSTLVGAVMYMHKYSFGFFSLFFGFICLLLCLTLWWRDVIREATFENQHTAMVQRGLRLGMILFIVSEIMFFFGFFWAFFHSSLAPTIEIGSVWPPMGIESFNPFQVPLINTLILLLSGASITWAHNALILNNRKEVFLGFSFTVFLAVLFTALQVKEYLDSSFSISDGIYGSTFFMATGFHGFHVIIGTIFISVCFYRFYKYHFTSESHLGFEAAAWYWHFVDVVWLFLYISIYWWGSL